MAMDDLDIEQLATRAAAGDTGARDALLARIAPQVMRQCQRILPCREDAEEACQDTLLQVALKLSTFDGRARFSTWLYAVTANCARQTYRSLKRRASEQATPQLPVDAPDPRTTSVIAGSRLDLLDALEQLEAHRAELVVPLVLRDLCQLSYEEIAGHLNIPSGTLKSRIHDARRHVRATLDGG
jgi:RNA polymerase sigma factor (sigma-70 family)